MIQLVIFGGPLAIAAYIGNANLYRWDAENRREEIRFQQEKIDYQIQQDLWMEIHEELTLAGQLIRHENMPIPADIKHEWNSYVNESSFQQLLDQSPEIVVAEDGTWETRPPKIVGVPSIDWSEYEISHTPFDIAILKIKFESSKAYQLGQVYRDQKFLDAVTVLDKWVNLAGSGIGLKRDNRESLSHEDCMDFLNRSLTDLLIRIRLPKYAGDFISDPQIAESRSEFLARSAIVLSTEKIRLLLNSEPQVDQED
jgi:hypothetical protein